MNSEIYVDPPAIAGGTDLITALSTGGEPKRIGEFMQTSSLRLFVSYAHSDEVRVAQLAAILRAGGFDPWWDDRLEPGENWKDKLSSSISECDAFLFLISDDSIESEWCQWELAEAGNLSKPIVPILIRRGTAIPSVIAHLHYLDASSGFRNLNIAKLVGKLARLGQPLPDSKRLQPQSPIGTPSRFHRPLPREYRTVAQGYLQPLAPEMRLHQWVPSATATSGSSGHVIGIDFGTTVSSVAVYRNGSAQLIPNDFGETETPSAVAIGLDGAPIIGRRAVDFLLLHPERGVLEVKRLFGHEVALELSGPPVLVIDGAAYTPMHLAAFVLRQLRLDAEAYLGLTVTRAVLTAPAYFDQSQSSTLIQSARLADMKVVRVVPEPVAACMAVKWTSNDITVLVYDFGGGTFDASVLECEGPAATSTVEVKSINGDTRLGGADFDRLIVDYCLDTFREESGLDLRGDATALMRIRQAAESAKIALSSMRTTIISVPYVGFAGGKPLHLSVELSQSRCTELTQGLVSRTLALSRAALADAGLSTETVDRALVVGRAARAANAALALKDLFGERLQPAPDNVVALGAALQAAVLSGEHSAILLLDSLAHTLRIQVAGGYAYPAIARNTTIPTVKFVMLRSQRAGQRTILINVLAGENSWPNLDLLIVKLRLSCCGDKKSEREVILSLDIDANSELIVCAECGNCKSKTSEAVGLRHRMDEGPVEQNSSHDEFNLPILADPPRAAPIPGLNKNNRILLQRWICQTAAEMSAHESSFSFNGEMMSLPGRISPIWRDMVAWMDAHPNGEVPSEFVTKKVLVGIDRELLIDQLEQRLGRRLPDLRFCRSVQEILDRLMEGNASP